jgi:hypothetical protein
MSDVADADSADSASGDYYALMSESPSADHTGTHTDGFDDILGSEPADPDGINHDQRERRRIADPWVKTERLPKPLVECGCGECPDCYDPLADEEDVSDAFSDVLDRSKMAADECDEAQPMTVERAGRAYYVYQIAQHRRDDWTSKLDMTVAQHGQYLDGERTLLTEELDNVSTALLSLRPRPVGDPPDMDSEDDDYGLMSENPSATQTDASNTESRRWRSPVSIDWQLHQPIKKVRAKLRYQLHDKRDFEFEYVWVVAGTDSAATPHLHLLVYVEDPDDELTTDPFEPAVDAFVNHCQFAHDEDHPIGDDTDSDAVVVHTDPTKYDEVDDEQLVEYFYENGEEGFELNTAALAYLLHQRPHWVLRHINADYESLPERTKLDLQTAAIAWASPTEWIQSSGGFPT